MLMTQLNGDKAWLAPSLLRHLKLKGGTGLGSIQGWTMSIRGDFVLTCVVSLAQSVE